MKGHFSFPERWNNIIYKWTTGVLSTLPYSFTKNITGKGMRDRWRLILKNFASDVLRLFFRTKIPKEKIWFLVLTQNNLEALKGIKEEIPDSIYVSFRKFRSKINAETYYFNLPLKFLFDLMYPFSWIIYYRQNHYRALKYFDLLFEVNGSYENSVLLLKRYRPRAIVFTNDHLVIARSLLLAAKKLDITTYYVQHACVSKYFPPLQFTHAFLDGQDAFDKYSSIGDIESKVHLVGISKFDRYTDVLNDNKNVKVIGIAFNFIEEIEKIYSFTKKLLLKHPDLSFLIRPHPGDRRDLTILGEFELSDTREENSFQFLSKIDVLITGDSSLHLEAVLINVYPIYYSFDSHKRRFDYYGFLQNKLVDYCKNMHALNESINRLKSNKPDIRHRAKYYNASVGTDFYGKSTKKVVDTILKTIP